jgi:hypothetical protein
MNSFQVRTLAGLCACTRSDLARWKNLGKKGINDLAGALATFGLSFKNELPVQVSDANLHALYLWLDRQLDQYQKLGGVDDAFARERDLLTNVMRVLDGRPVEDRQANLPKATLEERCARIADTVVPGFRTLRSGASCTSAAGKRWGAAWDAACIALGGVPADYKQGGDASGR